METLLKTKTPTPRAHRLIPEWLHVSRPCVRRVLWLMTPLALQVVLSKAVKFAVLEEQRSSAFSFHETIPDLLTQHVVAPLLALLAATVLAILLRRLGANKPVAAFGFVVVIGIAVYAMKTALFYSLPWLSLEFLKAVRLDLVEMLAFASVALLAVEHTRGRARTATLLCVHLVVPALMMFGIMELGYFLRTGSIADAFMLRYALLNFEDLSYVMSAELSGLNLVVLLLPLAFTLLPLLIEKLTERAGTAKRRLVLPLFIAAAVLLLVMPRTTISNPAQAIAKGTYAGLIEGMVTAPVWERDEIAGDEELAPIFDTQSLQALPAEDARADPMNVVFIILESQRAARHLPEKATPFFDSLAARSLAIEELSAVVPHTNKALVPILCGIFPRINQGEEPHVPGTCLPELLRPHGYRSAFFTSATLLFERKGEMLENMGFDDAFGSHDYDAEGFSKLNYFGLEERVMLQPSMEWIDDRLASSTPFFLSYLTLSPHHPYTGPPNHEPIAFSVENPEYRSYLNTLAYVDGFVAELFAGFESRRIIDNTLFVVFSDHGEAFGEHGLHFHSAVPYEEALHVPAIIFNPVLFPEPDTVGGWRQQIDLLPTVIDLLGLELTGGRLPGVSVFDPVPEDRRLYHAAWIENQSMALRVGPRKFVYHYRRKPIEVFNLNKDPFERNDLAHEYTEKDLEAVEIELLRWRRRVNRLFDTDDPTAKLEVSN